ncbi:MAG TPA: NfeD family protein [Acidimicrobiales bacterium]|nr:NfeD family protein [Acidimicrobiales bacterium]
MTPSDGQAIGHGEHKGVASVDLRAAEAAAGLRLAGDEQAPELRRLMHPARTTWLVTAVVSLAAVAIVGVLVLGLASATDTVQLAWVTGAVLALLLVLTWVLCVHAGGHAWLVPVPACILAVAWALTAASGNWSSTPAWLLAVASAAMSAAAVLVAGTALRQRVTALHIAHLPVAGADGIALTPLSPTGVVRVASEMWSAESVSGPLPEGAPVHVVRVRGLRLLVWSELGAVPGADALEGEEGLP